MKLSLQHEVSLLTLLWALLCILFKRIEQGSPIKMSLWEEASLPVQLWAPFGPWIGGSEMIPEGISIPPFCKKQISTISRKGGAKCLPGNISGLLFWESHGQKKGGNEISAGKYFTPSFLLGREFLSQLKEGMKWLLGIISPSYLNSSFGPFHFEVVGRKTWGLNGSHHFLFPVTFKVVGI